MSNPGSILAYPDVKSAFERALVTERGIKVSFTTHAQAVRFVGRCNSFRVLDRKENIKIYHELTTHQLYGRSVFDHLRISIKENDVFIVPIKLDDTAVMDL